MVIARRTDSLARPPRALGLAGVVLSLALIAACQRAESSGPAAKRDPVVTPGGDRKAKPKAKAQPKPKTEAGARARKGPPRRSVATVLGVEVSGRSRSYSATRPPPQWKLVNRSAKARTVRLVRLVSLRGAEEREHRIRSAPVHQLAPGGELILRVRFDGRPLVAGWGRYFRLRAAVDGQPIDVHASTHYVCRIPRRR